MVDPTAFARFLPTFQGGGLASIQAAQAGQQMGLQDIKAQEFKRQQARTINLNDLGEQAKNAWKNGDQKGFTDIVAEIASIDPKAAAELNTVLGGLSKQNAVESGTNFFAAASLPSKGIESQNYMLSKAQEPLPQGHVFSRWIDQVKMLPEGKERTQQIQQGLELAKSLGMIPGTTVGSSGKTADQIERELKVKEQGVLLRRDEIEERKNQFKRNFGRFQPGVEKRYNTISDQLIDTEKNIGEYESLAFDMDNLAAKGVKGGIQQTIQEWLKTQLGTTDEASRLLTKARGITASAAMRNLPPGAASDADVAMALRGLPPQNSSPQTFAAWMRGTSKLMRIDAAYKNEQLKYLENSEDGSIRGWNTFWQENKTGIIANALGMSEEQVNTKSIEKEKAVPVQTPKPIVKNESINDVFNQLMQTMGQ